MGPQDPKDVTQAIACDLSGLVGDLSSMKAHANHWLKDPNYEALRLRLGMAHTAAETGPPLRVIDRLRINEANEGR